MKMLKYLLSMSVILLFVSGCSIFHSPSWEEVEIGTTHTIEKILFTGNGNGYLITDGGEIFAYESGEWNKIANPDTLNLPLYDMDLLGNAVYICGGKDRNSIVMKIDTSGSATIVMRDTLGKLTGIDGVDANSIWACGENVIYYFNGSYWATKYLANSWDPHPFKVGALSGETAYFIAVKDSGSVLMKYSNGSWSTITLGSGEKLNDIFFLNRSTGYIVGNKNKIYYYDGGAFVEDQSMEDLDIPLYAVYKNDVNTGYVVGGLGSGLISTIYHFDQGKWEKEEGIKNAILRTVFYSNENDVWTGGDLGKLFHKH
ncbi:MAG: hypothetical protein GWP03_02995 [Proteobacteria bacterium]|nr:hypothetical protein [Pseudomonadota bacterium]